MHQLLPCMFDPPTPPTPPSNAIIRQCIYMLHVCLHVGSEKSGQFPSLCRTTLAHMVHGLGKAEMNVWNFKFQCYQFQVKMANFNSCEGKQGKYNFHFKYCNFCSKLKFPQTCVWTLIPIFVSAFGVFRLCLLNIPVCHCMYHISFLLSLRHRI